MSNPRIFISYSHRGEGPKWKTALVNALHVFEQQHLLDVWQDGKIRVSSFWDDDIKQAMSSASLAIILLTKEALESDYIINTEFEFLSKRQRLDKMPIFPIVCEECNWRSFEWLRATQAPNESNPLSDLTQIEQDRVFRKLATDIAEEISRFAFSKLQGSEKTLADEKVFLDKFPLTRGPGLHEEKLIGREQEIALLDLAFIQPHTAIVSLVAWGGVGKSMLVQKWLLRLQQGGWFGMQRVYAWSFFSQGAMENREVSEDMFLNHALEWFNVHCEPSINPWQKGSLLADAMAKENTLLILDGIEPMQYPPGPMGGIIKSPGIKSLLTHLSINRSKRSRSAHTEPYSTFNSGLCLVTTREPLTDLIEFQRQKDSSLGVVLRINLVNLPDQSGAYLLHHMGVNKAGVLAISPNDNELMSASHEVGGHALTLKLLGRYLTRAHGGDIRRREMVKFEEADLLEQGGTTFKMLAIFENWFVKSGEFGTIQLTILRILGLFDRPADTDCIDVLRKPPAILGLSDNLFNFKRNFLGLKSTSTPIVDEVWKTAISFLVDFGLIDILISYDTNEALLDYHPLIREYFSSRAKISNPKSWREAHARLYSYLKSKDNSTDNLDHYYKAVFQGVNAGLEKDTYINVYDKFISRGNDPFIGNYSTKIKGNFGSDLAVLSHFYDSDWNFRNKQLDNEIKMSILNASGICLRALGRLSESLIPLQKSLDLAKNLNLKETISDIMVTISNTFLSLGQIRNALNYGQSAFEHSFQTKSNFHIIMAQSSWANALAKFGNTDEAKSAFFESEILQITWQPEFYYLHSIQGYNFMEFELKRIELVAMYTISNKKGENISNVVNSLQELFSRAKTLLSWEVEGRLLDMGLDYLILGKIELYFAIFNDENSKNTHIDEAQNNIVKAIDLILKSGNIRYLPNCYIAYSWILCVQNNFEQAIHCLDEAMNISNRSSLMLSKVDIYLMRILLFHKFHPYPWDSVSDDFVTAQTSIELFEYHQQDPLYSLIGNQIHLS